MNLGLYILSVFILMLLVAFTVIWMHFPALTIPELIGLALFFDLILAVAFCYLILKGK